MNYEYMMVQMPPTISVPAKEWRGHEAAFYLQSIANILSLRSEGRDERHSMAFDLNQNKEKIKMITVKVIHSSTGKPVKGERIAVGFSSLGRGVTDSEYTNEDGEAHFDADPGEGEIYINGSSKHKGNLRGKVIVYI